MGEQLHCLIDEPRSIGYCCICYVEKMRRKAIVEEMKRVRLPGKSIGGGYDTTATHGQSSRIYAIKNKIIH